MPPINTIEKNNYDNFNSVNSDYRERLIAANSEEHVTFMSNSLHRIWLNDLPVGFNSHWHSALEIIVPMENWYDAVIGSMEYHLEPGHIFIIPPGEVHELMAPDSGKRFIFLMNISIISKISGFAGIQSLLTHPLHITKETYPLVYDDIYQILVQIRNEYFQNSEYSELVIQARLIDLFVKLAENHIHAEELFPTVKPYKQKEYVQKFNQTLEYIDSHYTEDISLDTIANQAGFSKFHFSRLFKIYTNYTFCDYLCYRRIKAAEELLAIPDYSITDVAMQAGFSSISTFNRLFKQHKGCTPSEYRSKHTVAGYRNSL